MRMLSAAAALLAVCVAVSAQAKPNVVQLYAEAVLTADIPALETLLAPSYWHIAANGHIEDKAHFLKTLRNRELVVDRLDFANTRETRIGATRTLTGTGHFKGRSKEPRPQGLMRFVLVLAQNGGREQVVLFQATPVVATPDCQDGNCRIQ